MSTGMATGMELENNLPQTLVRTMSDRVEVSTFDYWRNSDGAVSISSSLATPATYDEQRSVWRRPGSQKDLESAINQYLQQNKHEFNSKWSTWQGVLEQLDSATTIYYEKARGNPARATIRGLLVIFNAVKRRSEACEKVFHCFKLIPETIARVHSLERLFPHEKGVKACIDDFYSMLTASIPRLIRILNRKESETRVIRMGKLLLGDQVKDVDACIQPVNETVRKLNEYVHNLERSRDARTAKTTDNIHSNLNIVRSEVSEIRQDLKSLIGGLNEPLEAIRERYATIRESQIKEITDEATMAILNGLYRMLAERCRTKDFDNQGTIPQAPWQTLPALPRAQTIGTGESLTIQPSLDDLLEALGGEPVCLESLNDHGEILRKCNQFSDRALRQAAYLKSAPYFPRWLSATTSDILLVDGHDTRGKISAMSVFCAMLVQALWNMQDQFTMPPIQSIALFFACGAHTEPEDILTGPSGIVRSLIGQVLVSWPGQAPDLTFINEADTLLSDIQENRIDALCFLFQKLLRQLPSETVLYCVVDGISLYETSYSNWKDDLDYLVEVLRDLTDINLMHESHGPVLKVLLASADKSTDVYRLVPNQKRVDLRAQNQVPTTPTELSLLEDIQHSLQPEA
ncbi:hypothetical protein F5B22DRAFT_643533 [Xylaria bambusicola]|uniref:uncharacterized protein n=1 Tax=Xylaria bambusicola TaxID=326684 RepID=UPI002007C649|nr:uncharacterized protein F5B22DRAFT_643533 [Xylaria bambusicola]KAI0521951.1 hypothetical protein F5B22DRAFT_643533 [Xylaria bambusicola]